MGTAKFDFTGFWQPPCLSFLYVPINGLCSSGFFSETFTTEEIVAFSRECQKISVAKGMGRAGWLLSYSKWNNKKTFLLWIRNMMSIVDECFQQPPGFLHLGCLANISNSVCPNVSAVPSLSPDVFFLLLLFFIFWLLLQHMQVHGPGTEPAPQ